MAKKDKEIPKYLYEVFVLKRDTVDSIVIDEARIYVSDNLQDTLMFAGDMVVDWLDPLAESVTFAAESVDDEDMLVYASPYIGPNGEMMEWVVLICGIPQEVHLVDPQEVFRVMTDGFEA